MRVTGTGSGGWKVQANTGQSIVKKNIAGLLWTPHDSARNWFCVASSADGTKLAAVVLTGRIYTSTDSGVTWFPRDSARIWRSVASSADGTNLVAVVSGGQIYTSANSGLTWTPRFIARKWWRVASSSDGTRLAVIAVNDYEGQIYSSNDSGATWELSVTGNMWAGIAMSSDGTKLVATAYGGQIHTASWLGSGATSGLISGKQFDAVELQYVGNNLYTILSHEGDLFAQ